MATTTTEAEATTTTEAEATTTTEAEATTTTEAEATTTTTAASTSSTLVPRDALVLVGEAVCGGGVTSVTWTVSNNTSASIAGTDLNLAFGVSGVTVAAGGSQEAIEEIVGPAAAMVVSNEFYGAAGVGAATVPFYAYGSVNVAACVAVGTTTTGPATTSTVPPSTVPPPPGLVLAGEAVCAGGVTSVTWTVSNNTSASIAGTDLNLAFGVSGVTVPAGDSQEAVEEIAGPAAATVVNNEFYGASGSGPSTQPFYASASVAVAACTPAATTTTVPEATTTTTEAEATTTTAAATTTRRRRRRRRRRWCRVMRWCWLVRRCVPVG